MKKVLFVFALLTASLGAFAQNAGETVVELMNGSIARGELIDVGDGQRLYIKTANGSTIYFTRRAVKEIGNQRASSSLRNFRNPVTVYLRNGSVITGQLTELPEGGEMKIETPNRSIVYFTERSLKEVVSGDTPAIRPRVAEQQNQTASTEKRTTTPREQQARSAEPRTAATTKAEQVLTQPEEPLPSISGYKGFLDAGYTSKMGDLSKNRIEITMSHGYQINSSLFIGIGLGVNIYNDGFYKNDTKRAIDEAAKQNITLGGHKKVIAGTVDSLNIPMALPVFADIRYNFTKGNKFVPFAGLKAGYTLGLGKSTFKSETVMRTETSVESLGFYVAPSIGGKYIAGSRLAFNFTLGYTMQMFDYSHKDAAGANIVSTTKNNGGISFRIGIEF
ncbi:MAG: hypothetical protein LBH58_12630 [Tannerellaceae bacterium]|jgi:hypothetical protein|nr:hypothetical protein [Tannerellaceae bacterium]